LLLHQARSRINLQLFSRRVICPDLSAASRRVSGLNEETVNLASHISLSVMRHNWESRVKISDDLRIFVE
jgi:hypothetical protein